MMPMTLSTIVFPPAFLEYGVFCKSATEFARVEGGVDRGRVKISGKDLITRIQLPILMLHGRIDTTEESPAHWCGCGICPVPLR